MKINIIDSIMGSGKTTSVINYINNSGNDEKFIYVTPYKTEVERIIESCKDKHFKQPEEKGTKLNGLKILLKKGYNIATTHALFHLFDDETMELCYSQGYKLFMDEVTDVVSPYYIAKDDIDVLLKDFIDVDKDSGLMIWRETKKDYDHNGVFIEVKRLCDNGSLAMYGTNVMIWMFPVKIFKAFEESYILTYMFDAQMQKYYYDFHGLQYKYLYVEGEAIDEYHFTEEEFNPQPKYNYKKLINIVDNDKLNRIGDIEYSLSKTWYEKHQNDVLIKTLKKNVINFFTNIVDNKATNNNLWTTFKDYKDVMKGKGYTKGFLSATARATNDYKDRHNVAYLINRFFNPYLKQFFLSKGIDVHEDRFALSEMLQFIWRSAIRQGEPINLYIPSKRMRVLLENWIEENNIK